MKILTLRKVLFFSSCLLLVSACTKSNVSITDEEPTNPHVPSLLFNEDELSSLKTAFSSPTGSLEIAFDSLILLSDEGLSFTPFPYTGTVPMDFYLNLKTASAIARDLAIAYQLTENVDYAEKAVAIIDAYADACTGIQYDREAGTSMLIARSLYPLLCAYDLLKGDSTLTTSVQDAAIDWFEGLVPQMVEGVTHWEENDYFNKQDYQNHLVSHLLGLFALGYVLEDDALVQYATDSPQNPRDLYEMITGIIFMEGDTPCHREDPNAAAPEDGEIYDRYRHRTGPVRGLQYAHLSLTQLGLIARMCGNNGLDVFGHVTPTGEHLKLSYDYYSDFYRLMESCIKTNFYCGETHRIGRASDIPGMFEIGFNAYPTSQPIVDLIQSGVYNRGTSYVEILGFTRFYSISADPSN